LVSKLKAFGRSVQPHIRLKEGKQGLRKCGKKSKHFVNEAEATFGS